MRVRASEVKEILAGAFQLTRFKMMGADPVVKVILENHTDVYRETMEKVVAELLPLFKGEEIGGMKLEHYTSGKQMWWVRIEKPAGKDEDGHDVIDVDNLGDFETEEEAEAFCEQYEKEHANEEYELETIGFDPEECWCITGENGVKQYCEEQGKEVYPSYGSERMAVAVMVVRLGYDYLPATVEYVMKSANKRAEKRLLRAIFGSDDERIMDDGGDQGEEVTKDE